MFHSLNKIFRKNLHEDTLVIAEYGQKICGVYKIIQIKRFQYFILKYPILSVKRANIKCMLLNEKKEILYESENYKEERWKEFQIKFYSGNYTTLYVYLIINSGLRGQGFMYKDIEVIESNEDLISRVCYKIQTNEIKYNLINNEKIYPFIEPIHITSYEKKELFYPRKLSEKLLLDENLLKETKFICMFENDNIQDIIKCIKHGCIPIFLTKHKNTLLPNFLLFSSHKNTMREGYLLTNTDVYTPLLQQLQEYLKHFTPPEMFLYMKHVTKLPFQNIYISYEKRTKIVNAYIQQQNIMNSSMEEDEILPKLIDKEFDTILIFLHKIHIREQLYKYQLIIEEKYGKNIIFIIENEDNLEYIINRGFLFLLNI